ncbi:peptide transporter [Burkholderia reimsis]|uniref:Peptide transporter n=1 Tax=Burkholderia reimsis TaxID=2234132 RepID=A0A365QIL3_9BURK|nr:peptide transporter [Burkholderia reimsis]RBB33101.1 peptide transporter [Burkholderia reimsis]
MKFNLEKFEKLVYRRSYELAGRELLALLNTLDRNYGTFAGNFLGRVQSSSVRDERDEHLLTRLTAALTSLVTDDRFQFSDSGFATTLNLHRWLSAVFAASPFRNADHILRSFGEGEFDVQNLTVNKRNLKKFQLFYFLDSEIPIDMEAIWQYDKKLMAGLAMALLSPRFLGTEVAHQKRNALLKWLPSRLDEVDLGDLPGAILHDVYMHCSYADYSGKHEVKKPINKIIRRKLLEYGLDDLRYAAQTPANGVKPVLMVVLEWFTANHSIYRTHSLTIQGMRDHFYVIGVGYGDKVDETTRQVFDEFIQLSGDGIWSDISQVRDISMIRDVQVLYMPSVGMFPLTMVQSNLRVAPIQIMALGHPATSHSSVMDYVVVEEDYVGDPDCFSEELLILPSDGMPYRPPVGMSAMKPLEKRASNDGAVRIAVAATTMKLNPGFLKACGQIAAGAKFPVEFHFLVGQAIGLVMPQVRRFVNRYLGEKAIVHEHQPYEEYMNQISRCDIFLNPFPFGNTNGIVDTVYSGLVGVCKTGREVHEHIDEGMFRRLNFPSWLIADDIEKYVDAALRLINEPEERRALANALSGPNALTRVIFTGRPKILGDKIWNIWQSRLASTVDVNAKERNIVA